MNILLTPSRSYFKYVYVLLKSLYVNHPEEEIHVYVCCDVSENCKRELQDFALHNHAKGSLCFIDSPKERIMNRLKISTTRPYEVYYKLFCIGSLPEDIDRILYLDVDTVVNGSLADLYGIEFKKGECVAACGGKGFKGRGEYERDKALAGQYFNSGVVLFNLCEIRARQYFDDILDMKEIKGYYFDQGLLNHLFCDKAVYLPTELYNYRFGCFVGDGVMDYKSAKIIHYSNWRTPYKPWDLYFEDNVCEMGSFQEGEISVSVRLNDMFSVWWKYADMLESERVGTLRDELQCKTEWFVRSQSPFLKNTSRLLQVAKEKESSYKECELRFKERENKLLETQSQLQFQVDKMKGMLNVSKEWVNFVLDEKVKLALLGSCFSRVCMMGMPFFNENYRDYVDLSYIFYHSSYVSLMSDKIDYDTTGKKTKDESFQRSFETWAEMEFKKDFFENLEKTKPEYLIIDNYADATCSIYETADKKYFTGNYFIKSADVVKDFEGIRSISYDTEEKWAMLEKCIPAFFAEVVKYVPLNKIILVKGRMTEKRMLNGKVVLWDDAEWIRKKNSVWEKIDEFIIRRYPNIRIIDMTNTKYVSDDNFPLGNTSSHYQSGYYRELFLEYNKIFIEDRKKKR